MARMRRRASHSMLIALCAGSCLSPATLSAQDAAPPPANAPREITGRDFAGVRLPMTAVRGQLRFAAAKATDWSEGDTRRLLLEGDVRITLASYTFRAKRAAVWLERISGDDAHPRFQVFVYFDELGAGGDAAGAVTLSSDALPVKGIVEAEGGVELAAALVVQGRPDTSAKNHARAAEFMRVSEAALAVLLRRTLGIEPPAAPPPPTPRFTPRPAPAAPPKRWVAELPLKPEPVTPAPGPESLAPVAVVAASAAKQPPQPAEVAAPAPDPEPAGDAPIFAEQGVIMLASKNVTHVQGEDENAVIATGGVTVQYQDLSTGRTLHITAQRAVLFLDPGELKEMTDFSASRVRGIFLEGDVIATDGRFTVRGPQIYYDVRNNKAIMLEAVFWTYDERRRLPLYVRAKSIRQESAAQFIATSAVFTNSAFFDPELSLGASSVTISRQERTVAAEGARLVPGEQPTTSETRTIVDARNITVRAGGVPFFYWPTYSGDLAQFPIKDLRFENRAGSGAAFKATLNAYSLLGLERPGDFQADVLADWFVERGAALGTKLGWNQGRSRGGVFAYGLPDDTGTDLLKPGTKTNRNGGARGIVLGEERWRVDEHWTIFAEAAYISDETFVDAFFEDLGETRREFTNRVMAQRVEDNTSLAAGVNGTFNDFISNEYLLQSQGFSVTRLPEAAYIRQADDLLPRSSPGLLTYFSEYRAGQLSMAFDEVLASEHGFTTNALAQRALGINADQSLGDVFRASGLTEDAIARLDTRHELSMQTSLGPVRVTPFVIGRITFYDDTFDTFSPQENDQTRLWGATGVRVSTTTQRVFQEVDSRTLDIHRLRHLVEPNATFFVSGSSFDSEAIPVYDDAVESLAEGTMTRFGVTQTLQTQRGGPGRWHDADLMTLSTDMVISSGDTNPQSPIGRFFDYRPELSNPGTFFVADAALRLTDATTLTANTVYDFDADQQAATTTGLMVRQSPTFTTFADVRFINPQDSTYLILGASYELTSKYAMSAGTSYDVEDGGFQAVSVEVRRRFASMLFGVSASYNDITGEMSFGFVFQPYGALGTARLSGFGSDAGAGMGSVGGN